MIELGGLGFDLSDPWVLAALVGGAAFLLLALLLIWALTRMGRLATEVQALAAGQHGLAGAQKAASHTLHGTLARTGESLGALEARLAAIDRAQANIERLSGDVLGLQDILANKQARGAFGEIQLHDIVAKALPPDAWDWQVTLANGRRADCLIRMPDPPGPIVIDAKFPLEPYEAWLAADDKRAKAEAARAFRTATRAHIRAIADKYIAPGETAEQALMFIPSEAVFAELHASFGDVVREGFTAKVWTVSPTTCMAVLHTLRAVLRDARMREQAGAMRAVLRLMHRDVEQVSERVARLKTHLGQASGDLDGIETAAARARRRADRLEAMEFDGAEDDTASGIRILRN
ncbi:MAG: DNA recombination protein RmuC [Pseudomonadota bacterium]